MKKAKIRIGIKDLSRYLVIASFAAITIVLTLGTYIDWALPASITSRSLCGAICAILLIVFLYFDEKINNLKGGGGSGISFPGFNAAFTKVSKKLNFVHKVRIYAVSSGKILSLFSSSKIKVDECHIILRNKIIGLSPSREELDFKNELDDMIRDWNFMVRKGRINKLTVDRYEFLPTEYQVIFDDKIMIIGLYSLSKESYSEVEVEDPILIDDTTFQGRQLIAYYTARFDSFPEYLRK